jgi:MraZ protein
VALRRRDPACVARRCLEKGHGVAISDQFRGKALNAVDAKGRVSVPADYRGAIQMRHRRLILQDGFDPYADEPDERRRTGKIVILVKDPVQPCLMAFDNAYSRAHRDLIDSRHADKTGVEREAAVRKDLTFFGSSEDMPWDVNGRIVLPPRIRAKAGITDFVYFFGMSDTFGLWNPATFVAVHQEEFPDLADECREFCDEKGVAL